MASVASPYGFKVVGAIGADNNVGNIRELPMTANSANAIFFGSLVNIAGGTAKVVAATPTTTADGNTPIGVCVGVRYVDPVLKQELHAMFLPANAITNGYTNVFIKVVDDPNAMLQIQANATLTNTAVGLNATVTNPAAGSTTTGVSSAVLTAATVAATATFGLRIIRLLDPGAAFPDVLVKFNQGVHAYQNATGQ